MLALVAEKTGYPPDMLDLDLDLEADLGIDTVKQAEMFAAIREAYGIARDDKLKLRDYPTLDHVDRLRPRTRRRRPTPPPRPRRPRRAGREPPPRRAAESAPARPTRTTSRERVLALVAEKTGYPPDMLDLDLDLEADLGIDTVKQAEVFAAIREAYGIPRDDKLKLRDYPTLAHVIGFVRDRAGTDPTAPADGRTAEPAPPRRPPRESAPAAVDADDVAARCSRSWPRRPATRPTCSTSTSTSKPTSASTPSSRPRSSPPSARPTASRATTTSSCATSRPSPTSIGFVRDRAGTAPGHRAAAARRRARARRAAAERAAATARRPAAAIPAAGAGARAAPAARPLRADRRRRSREGSRVVVMPDRGGVGAALAERLAERGVEVLAIDGDAGRRGARAASSTAWPAAGPIHGRLLAARPRRRGRRSTRSTSPAGARRSRVRVKLLAATMRALYEQVARAGTFLVSATRLGGRHGYDDAGAVAPLGGAVTGFTKAFARERPRPLVKAVDFEAGRHDADDVADAARRARRCATRAPSRSATRTACGGRVGARRAPAADAGRRAWSLGPDTVFVVTGAAGSIVSAITADLAAALGRHVPPARPGPRARPRRPRPRPLRDRQGRPASATSSSASSDRGERATPALVERELARLERAARRAAAHRRRRGRPAARPTTTASTCATATRSPR